MTYTFKKLSILITFFLILQNTFASSRPIITKINVSAQSTKTITLSWTLPEKSEPQITGLQIFRDNKVISSYEQLDSLTPIAVLASDVQSFTDSVPDYKEYYYAVITVTEKGQYKIILPSINTTVIGIRRKSNINITEELALDDSKKEKLYPDGTLREVPLPAPDLLENQAKAPVPMGKKANDQIKSLAGNYINKTPETLEHYFFEKDMFAPEGGDDYLLFKVLRETLVLKDYVKAKDMLNDFLSIHREKDVTSRTQFYLAESLYFLHSYKDALYLFINLQDAYPEITKKWIDSCLDFIRI